MVDNLIILSLLGVIGFLIRDHFKMKKEMEALMMAPILKKEEPMVSTLPPPPPELKIKRKKNADERALEQDQLRDKEKSFTVRGPTRDQ